MISGSRLKTASSRTRRTRGGLGSFEIKMLTFRTDYLKCESTTLRGYEELWSAADDEEGYN